jgi:hypothetical protein
MSWTAYPLKFQAPLSGQLGLELSKTWGDAFGEWTKKDWNPCCLQMPRKHVCSRHTKPSFVHPWGLFIGRLFGLNTSLVTNSSLRLTEPFHFLAWKTFFFNPKFWLQQGKSEVIAWWEHTDQHFSCLKIAPICQNLQHMLLQFSPILFVA